MVLTWQTPLPGESVAHICPDSMIIGNHIAWQLPLSTMCIFIFFKTGEDGPIRTLAPNPLTISSVPTGSSCMGDGRAIVLTVADSVISFFNYKYISQCWIFFIKRQCFSINQRLRLNYNCTILTLMTATSATKVGCTSECWYASWWTTLSTSILVPL